MYGRHTEHSGIDATDQSSGVHSPYAKKKPEQEPSIQELEETAVAPRVTPPPTQPKKPSKISAFLRGKKQKAAPMAIIIALLFGGGVGFSTLFAPGIALMSFSEKVIGDTNSLLSAATKTNNQLFGAKLNNKVTAGSCGMVKAACRMQTVTPKTAENFKRAGIDMELKDSGFGNRRQITKLSFTDSRGNLVEITEASKLQAAMKDNIEFRRAMVTAHNPQFTTLKDTPAINFLKKMKTSYSKKLTGTTKEELDDDMKKAVSSSGSIDITRLKPQTDENGKETGNFVDDKGNVYTADEAKGLDKTRDLIKNSASSTKVLSSAVTGVGIIGAADTACTAYSVSNAIETGAKLILMKDLIRLGMVVNNTASAMKAGDVKPEQIEYIGNKLVVPDLREQVVDESKWFDSNTADNPPMVKNPNYKKTGLDAAFYKMSAYQDTPKITASEQRFMAGGRLTGTLGKFNDYVTKALGGGTKQQIKERCRTVQNPVVRGGSMVVGIIAGIGSFGWTAALGIAGSLAIAFATPYMISILSDMMAGDIVGPDLEGMDFVNAASVGTSGMLNGNAREHGLMPLPADEMVEYQNTNRQVQVAYDEIEKYNAKSAPFDVTNQFSFLGSLARTALPVSTSASASGVAVIQTIPSIIRTAGSLLTPFASAATSKTVSIDRYQMCNDTVYKEMNVAADPTCVLVYGLPVEAMELDPIDNAVWMAKNNEIVADSEDGTPKDNGKKWNYAKYIKECVEQQPGAYEESDENDDNGTKCGAKEYRSLNYRYAKFKLSMEVAKGQDGILPGVDGGTKDDMSSGETGAIGLNGWAYPTTSDGAITSGFGPRWGSEHRGVDLVPPNALGKSIFAARDGKVIAAGPASGFGNWIVIQHEVDGKRYDTVYGHMAASGVLVKQGDTVKAGQEIGKIGNEGQSTGPHLHFELWEGGHGDFAGGRAVDPTNILRAAHTDGTEAVNT